MKLVEANLQGQELGQPKLISCRLTKGINEVGWLTFEKIGQPTNYNRKRFHLYDGSYNETFFTSDISYDRDKNTTKYKCYDFNGILAQRIISYNGLIEDYGKDTNEAIDTIIYNILVKNYVSPYNTERRVSTTHGVTIQLSNKAIGDVASITYAWQNGLKAIQEIWKASNGRVNILPIWASSSQVTLYIYVDYHRDRTVFGSNPLVFSDTKISKQIIEASFSKEINTIYAMTNKYSLNYQLGAVVETVDNSFRIEGYVGNNSAKTVGEVAYYGQESIYKNRPYNQEINELILNNLKIGTDYNLGTAISVKKPYGFDQNVIRGLDIQYLSHYSQKEVRARIEQFRQANDALTARTYGAVDTP